jgi:DNA ligase 1
MRLSGLVQTSKRIGETNRRLEKVALLADFLSRLSPDELPIAVHYLSSSLRQGRIGVGYAALRDAMAGEPASEPELSLADVDRAFDMVSGATGRGSAETRSAALRDLSARATSEERDFLFRLVIGELRQGSLEGIMADAVARAARLPLAMVRRAVMLSGGLADVAQSALAEGADGLNRFSVRLFNPLRPMLAQTAEDAPGALGCLGKAILEYKLDGARIQAHKSGKDVRVFTRGLNEVTAAVPEIVELVRTLPPRDLILDGEAIVLRPDGKPQAFQVTMRRFGRKLDVPALRQEFPLKPFFFDCLFANGEALIDRGTEERAAALRDFASPEQIVPRLITESSEEAEHFALGAFRAGHEGIMAKASDAPYEAGSRGGSWLKVKQTHTLDLVILAAEWGHGRRRGWLSNLHLGARDPAGGQFVMLGKTFKGLTDEMLEWQTRRLQELEISRDAWTVYVRPELVAEIAFNDIQASPHYPGGYALRFARVKRYRSDKSSAEADTIETVRLLYRR